MTKTMVKLVAWVFVIVVLKDSGVKLQPERCDQSRRGGRKEGVLGSVQSFPWLGVLRVHLHQEATIKIALTGIVLVKDKYAIANADDITRIPKRVFTADSRAMFLSAAATPWYCRPVDYLTHPDYEMYTLASIALIELAPPPDTRFPMLPVCWPAYSYNTSNNLFAVGYTDENQRLEKFMYRLQYVGQELCKEFYTRAGLSEGMKAPRYYECGFASNNRNSCVWDNGMALVSNTSSYWVLVGLGLQGPGCAAPARFISLANYYSWIESATDGDEEELHGEMNYRKSAFNTGFKNKKSSPAREPEEVPAHELLREGSTAGAGAGGHVKHDFAHHYPHESFIHDPFVIQRVSGTEINISHPKGRPYSLGSSGDCNNKKIQLVYKDIVNITVKSGSEEAFERSGFVQYKMTLHDSMFLNYSCITLKLYARGKGSAYLQYDKVMSDGTIFPETPDDVIREHPFYHQTRLVEKDKYSNMKPAPVQSSGRNLTAHNAVLYLKIWFIDKCRLEVMFFGPRSSFIPWTRSTSTTSGTTTPTTPTTSTKDPYANLRHNVPLEVVQEVPDRVLAKMANNAPYSRCVTVGFWLVVIVLLPPILSSGT